MNHKDRPSLQRPRPFIIAYVRGDRRLADSAETMDGAKARIAARLAKRHNKGEKAEIYLRGQLIETIQ